VHTQHHVYTHINVLSDAHAYACLHLSSSFSSSPAALSHSWPAALSHSPPAGNQHTDLVLTPIPGKASNTAKADTAPGVARGALKKGIIPPSQCVGCRVLGVGCRV